MATDGMLNLSRHRLKNTGVYDGLFDDSADASLALFGAPFDETASFRKGAAKAPQAIRNITLESQETYSPYFNLDLTNLPICDVGNLKYTEKDTENCLEQTELLASEIFESGKFPFMLGGEHLLTLPALKAAYSKFPNLRLLHLDAHTDFIDVLFGKKLSHGTVMRRIWEFLGDDRIFGFGIRSGSKEDFAEYEAHTYCHKFSLQDAEKLNDKIGDFPVYLTVDLDVFDPSLIPGTGTPEAGGIFFTDFINFLKEISSLNIIGMDMMELAPEIDPSGLSTIIAGQVSREMMCAFFNSIKKE